MTIAARLPDGTLRRFAGPEEFVTFLTSTPPLCGVVQVLNGSPEPVPADERRAEVAS